MQGFGNALLVPERAAGPLTRLRGQYPPVVMIFAGTTNNKGHRVMWELLLDIAVMAAVVIAVIAAIGFAVGVIAVVLDWNRQINLAEFDERMRREDEADILGEASMYRHEPKRKREPEPTGA